LAINLGVHFHAGGKDAPQGVEADHPVLGEVLHGLDVRQNFLTEDGIQQVEVIFGVLVLLFLAKLLEAVLSIVEEMERSLEGQLFELGVETLKSLKCAAKHLLDQRALDRN
jgi:hypothetical protein